MLVPLRISRGCCCPLSPLKHARPLQVSMTTRLAAGAAEASVVVSHEERLIGRRFLGGGSGSAGWRKEKGHEAGGLRTYFEALVIYERHVYVHAPESLTESILSSDDRSRSHASPHAFASKLSRNTTNLPQLSQPTGTTMRSPSSVFDL